MPRTLAALAALAATLLAVSSAHAGLREAIGRCAPPAAEVVGLAALERACPGLTRALDDSGAGALLAEGSRDRLTLRGVELVRSMLESGATAPVVVPSTASLAPILKQLDLPTTAPTWWQRFKAWLRQLLGSPNVPKMPDWLTRWLDSLTLPQAVRVAVIVTLLLAILIAAGIVLARELRALGVGARRSLARVGALTPIPARCELTLADVETAPRAERARVLFRLVLQTLAQSGGLSGARSDTHRELRRRIEFPDPAQRERFVRLSEVAEEELFGATGVPAARLEPALADGAALYAALAADATHAS